MLKKEGKVWHYKMEALNTVNDTLTKRIQRYEEQEALLHESERKNQELEEHVAELTDDLERIRSERKSYKEENHKLMKKIIQMEEAFKRNERDYEDKLKKINYKLIEFQKSHNTEGIEEKLRDKSNQVKILVDKVKNMEKEGNKMGKT